MKTLFPLLFLFCLAPPHDGYKIIGDTIEFSYAGIGSHKHVYVAGNFNDWAKNGEPWKMKFDANEQRWKLNKPISDIRSYGDFLEFTFRVDGKLTDADRSVENVIHCAGYGYRYVTR